MSQSHVESDTKTELLDALLHTNIKRIAVAKVCAFVAALVMLLVSSFFQVETSGKLWWLQLMASMFYGGKAFVYDAPTSIYVVGFVIHIFFAGLCGFVVGKMTKRNELVPLLFYTFVLGFLTWLASNMFGPDFFDYQFLGSVGQWVRLVIFMSFTLTLGLLMSVVGKALKV